MIPKIIHQIWIGTKPMPISLMQSWQEKHPDWTYMLWTEEHLTNFFADGLANQQQYDEMSELAGKCDIARYEILYHLGGFYADADSICLAPLDDYLLANEFFASYENELSRIGLISNSFMGCVPRLPFLRAIIEAIGQKSGKTLWNGYPSAWRTVGPMLLTSILHQTKYSNAAIYPSYYFIPRHYTGMEYSGPAKSYATQYWGSTPDSGYDYLGDPPRN